MIRALPSTDGQSKCEVRAHPHSNAHSIGHAGDEHLGHRHVHRHIIYFLHTPYKALVALKTRNIYHSTYTTPNHTTKTTLPPTHVPPIPLS